MLGKWQRNGQSVTVTVAPLQLVFGGSPALTRIQTECATPEDFLSCLQAIQGVKLTALHATLTKLDNAVFNKIVEFLPHLTELLLIIAIAAEDVSSLFRREISSPKIPENAVVDGRRGNYARSGITVWMLKFHPPRIQFTKSLILCMLSSVPFLPPGLQRFAISRQFNEDDFYNEHCAYKLPNLAYIRDMCRAKCPGLTWIWLEGIYLMLEWRIMPDGTKDEFSTKNWIDGTARRQRQIDVATNVAIGSTTVPSSDERPHLTPGNTKNTKSHPGREEGLNINGLTWAEMTGKSDISRKTILSRFWNAESTPNKIGVPPPEHVRIDNSESLVVSGNRFVIRKPESRPESGRSKLDSVWILSILARFSPHHSGGYAWTADATETALKCFTPVNLAPITPLNTYYTHLEPGDEVQRIDPGRTQTSSDRGHWMEVQSSDRDRDRHLGISA
ncbi:hypothetical protein C8R45DRAFT_928852 [Mycena sanguinolenta]|nr:hypothetical protein C8R45DRAFT_928852 [Mycena sanguinolenta]